MRSGYSKQSFDSGWVWLGCHLVRLTLLPMNGGSQCFEDLTGLGSWFDNNGALCVGLETEQKFIKDG